jgi:DNA-directed RNA polymerase subunit beta
LPYVHVLVDGKSGKTYQQLVAEQASFVPKAPVEGTVTDISSDHIELTDGQNKKHKIDLYNYFPLNDKNYIHNTPLVKVGDKVKQGDILAEGWQTKNGSWAPGARTRVGYLPYKGYNYEDSVVISSDYANKMASEEMFIFEHTFPKGCLVGRGSRVKTEFKKCFLEPIKNESMLNEDCIIEEGSKVEPGYVLVGGLMPINPDELDKNRKLIYSLRGAIGNYKPVRLAVNDNSYAGGIVKKIVFIPDGNGDLKAKVYCLMSKPLNVGDKIAGRHGNKGTISKIVPTEDMPKTEDGKPLDLLFSPLGVPSRKNVGQLFLI